MTTESRDIVERLEEWASIAGQGSIVNGTLLLQTDLREAVATIKNYRLVAGAVSPGQSFRDIAENLPRRSTEPPEAA